MATTTKIKHKENNMITLKDIVKGQQEAKASSYNTDLFSGDRESIEWDKSAYSNIYMVTTDHQHDRGEHDKFVETVVTVGHESDFYLVTATHTSFNGEKQVAFTEQPITLKGFNYFTKDNEEVEADIYNNYLAQQGYELVIDDIKELGVFNAQYNVVTLSFKDDKDSMHYLTVNSKNQLSGITVKHSARKVNTSSSFQSAFA